MEGINKLVYRFKAYDFEHLDYIILRDIDFLINSDVDQNITNLNINILVHRGHSFYLFETFPKHKTSINTNQKLFFLGLCGGFRSVPDLAKSYDGCNCNRQK